MQGQLRTDNGRVVGWDLNAGLALADALGVPPFLAAEILPEIEVIACRKINEMLENASE